MICEINGKTIPVISTVQATHEWAVEYGRAKILRKCCIAELVTIALLSIALIYIWRNYGNYNTYETD